MMKRKTNPYSKLENFKKLNTRAQEMNAGGGALNLSYITERGCIQNVLEMVGHPFAL